MNVTLPDTTEHVQSLKTLAKQNEDTARVAWLEAKAHYQENPCTPNAIHLIQKLDAFKLATAQREQVSALYKHNHLAERRFSDGSDNTMAGSLRDAGFGEGGVM